MERATSAPGGRTRPGRAGHGGREGRLNRRNAIWAAIIGGIAVVAAALITTHPWSNGGLELAITSVSHPVVDGSRVIEVTGTVTNLSAGEYVYAFAGRQANAPPWYPGGPAAISGSGLWTAEITHLPGSAADLSVWAGVASPPPGCATPFCNGGSAVSQAAALRALAAKGPHAPELRRLTRPRQVTLPGSRPG
jgi:hypothetical protein